MSLTDADLQVYACLSTYCFGEAVCWPSQSLIASEVGRSQASVSRSIRRLVLAEWLRIAERRWSPRARKLHNVYELLEVFKPVSRGVADRIVARSRYRVWRRFAAKYASVNSNRRYQVPGPGPKRDRTTRQEPVRPAVSAPIRI